MRQETVEAIIAWQNALDSDAALEITFHGGEPLVPGADFYRMALPILRDGLTPRRVRFAIQTNLWLLTPDLCDLFRTFRVSIGSSLDGPEPINDAQRGKGYFKRTMAAIELARSRGLDVGCICTFTARTVPYAQEIFDFFIREGLNFSLHAALPSLRYPEADGWSLSPDAHGQLFAEMLARYLDNLDKIRVSTLDAMCRSVSAGHGGICTFGDCLGGYLAVGPDGEIYPCQRFAGMPEFQLGNVRARPSWESLSATPVWRAFQDREKRIQAECGECAHFSICRGGCAYNALVAGGGRFNGTLRDPHCPAYRHTFSQIVDRAMAEVFSDENMEAVVNRPDSKSGLLRRGKLLALMRDGPHPSEAAANARQILAAVALAETRNPTEAARRFERLGLTTNVKHTERGMRSLYQRLTTPSTALNNL